MGRVIDICIVGALLSTVSTALGQIVIDPGPNPIIKPPGQFMDPPGTTKKPIADLFNRCADNTSDEMVQVGDFLRGQVRSVRVG